VRNKYTITANKRNFQCKAYYPTHLLDDGRAAEGNLWITLPMSVNVEDEGITGTAAAALGEEVSINSRPENMVEVVGVVGRADGRQ